VLVARPERVAILVGPEGGWTDGERSQAAAAGWTSVFIRSADPPHRTAVIASLAILNSAYC